MTSGADAAHRERSWLFSMINRLGSCKSLLASTPREMKKRKFSVIFWIGAALLLAPWQGFAQSTATPPAAPQAAATPAAPVFKPEELDQILAPSPFIPTISWPRY